MLLKDLIAICKKKGAIRRQNIPRRFFSIHRQLILDMIALNENERMYILYKHYCDYAIELDHIPIKRSSFTYHISKLEKEGKIKRIRIRNPHTPGGWEVRVYNNEEVE